MVRAGDDRRMNSRAGAWSQRVTAHRWKITVKTVLSYGIAMLMLLCVSAFADEAKQSTAAAQSREAMQSTESMQSTPAMQGTGATQSSETTPATGAAQSTPPMQSTGAMQSAQAEQGAKSAPSTESKAAIEARIQSIVNSPEAAYVEPQQCLPVFTYDHVEILNDQTLLFHGTQKDKLWLNQLAGRCPGLRKNMTLKFELHQDQACNLDTFRGVEPFFWFWQNTTGICSLGKFQPVTPDQVGMVKQAIADTRS